MYQEELARRKFWSFCLYWDREFFTKRSFLKQVADVYQDIADGKVKTGQASMPPRAGKSYITSLFCAWWLGKNPTLTVMRNCATADLYKKFSYDIRAMIRDSKFIAIFPGVELATDKQDIKGWALKTSKQGVAYFGAGTGGTIIGFGCQLAVTDDLYADFADALSTTVNEATHLWKEGAHDSRMEKDCAELYVGTRWSQRDVIGTAMREGHIQRSVVISALTQDDRSFCEDVKSTAEYLAVRDKVDKMVWEAEYMQNPIEAFGLLFPIDKLRFYPPTMNLPGEYHAMFIDPANLGGDYFCSIHCVLVGNSIYIPHVYCNREGSEQSNILHEQYLRDDDVNMDYIEYEGVLQWQATASALRDNISDLSVEFRITKPTVNKHTRILVQSTFILTNIYFREDYKKIPEYRKFVDLLTTYLRDQSGKNKADNDDPPDVLAAAGAHFKRQFRHLFT